MSHIHFYLNFKESFEKSLWWVIALNSDTFSAPENEPEVAFETTRFVLFLKNLTKYLKKNLVIVFVLIE